MNIRAVANAVAVGISELSKGKGINRTISMSNTMKMILSRKKRIENGIRALFLGSNPHSNGDVFSRSEELRVESTQAAPNVNRLRTDAAVVENKNRDMDWESFDYLLIKS